MRQFLSRFFEGILNLFFPNLCLACSEFQPAEKHFLCAGCAAKLPMTNQHLEKNNDVTVKFTGRLPIETGAAFLYFSKTRASRELIHQLKYRNKPELAVRLGQIYGKILKNSPHFQQINYIVPVPLHPKKEWTRGYNQAGKFAEGLADGLGVEAALVGLKRMEHRKSQTQKKRGERYSNADQIYEVAEKSKLAGKHILLVDDVLTTGATMESCGKALFELPGTRVSIATIAMGKRGFE
jgi:ComF family protein